jgi:hypothetical protein
MKQVRTIELTHAVPLDGRGHRSNQTLLYLSERDNFLRAARDRFLIGMSDRAAAAVLHVRLARYREGAWRRDRVNATIEPTCPARYRGTITEWLWCVLRTRDHLPSERTVRAVLGR